MNFILTQSAVKDFEKEATCPARWKAQWVDKLISFPESLHLKKGNYFEWLILGQNAQGKTEIPTIPRLKNGEKSVDQVRIEEQAAESKRLLFDPSANDWLGFTLVNHQGFMEVEGRGGTYDILAKDIRGDDWVLDLKLTGDLSSTRTPYSWGNDWATMDLIQQVHYHELYRKTYNKSPRMGLFVADYSPKKRIEFGEIHILDNKFKEYEERFSFVEYAIKEYNATGWPRIPADLECAACPLQCEKRIGARKEVQKG